MTGCSSVCKACGTLCSESFGHAGEHTHPAGTQMVNAVVTPWSYYWT